jgi:putative addiction module component (TIGR02574 family)
MTVATKKIAEQILALPESQRAELISVLLKSIPEESDLLTEDEWGQAWAIELNRRISDMESGAVKGIPYSEVRKEIDAILGRS